MIDGRYRRRAWRRGEDAFTPVLLPRLTIDLAAIWPASASAERPEDR